MVAAIRGREISARELLELHLARIAERNPELNAVVSLDEERARAGAAAADQHRATGRPVGPLHGLPFAFKDTHAVAGWRTTYGSPLFAEHVPDADELPGGRVPRRRRTARGAGTPRRRRRDRADQRPGVRRGLAHLQPGLRDHAEPRRPVPL